MSWKNILKQEGLTNKLLEAATELSDVMYESKELLHRRTGNKQFTELQNALEMLNEDPSAKYVAEIKRTLLGLEDEIPKEVFDRISPLIKTVKQLLP
tara:strand:- start:58 stop:348 length:291 start_codon:yes stop_codon:yes gene_type:complete